MTNSKQDTKAERGAMVAEITAEWYRNRAKRGAKIADEIHDEKFRAILERGECRP